MAQAQQVVRVDGRAFLVQENLCTGELIVFRRINRKWSGFVSDAQRCAALNASDLCTRQVVPAETG